MLPPFNLCPAEGFTIGARMETADYSTDYATPRLGQNDNLSPGQHSRFRLANAPPWHQEQVERRMHEQKLMREVWRQQIAEKNLEQISTEKQQWRRGPDNRRRQPQSNGNPVSGENRPAYWNQPQQQPNHHHHHQQQQQPPQSQSQHPPQMRPQPPLDPRAPALVSIHQVHGNTGIGAYGMPMAPIPSRAPAAPAPDYRPAAHRTRMPPAQGEQGNVRPQHYGARQPAVDVEHGGGHARGGGEHDEHGEDPRWSGAQPADKYPSQSNANHRPPPMYRPQQPGPPAHMRQQPGPAHDPLAEVVEMIKDLRRESNLMKQDLEHLASTDFTTVPRAGQQAGQGPAFGRRSNAPGPAEHGQVRREEHVRRRVPEPEPEPESVEVHGVSVSA